MKPHELDGPAVEAALEEVVMQDFACRERDLADQRAAETTDFVYRPPHSNKTRDGMMGCICPPTSEQTCENPLCPRKNFFKERVR